MNEGIIEVGFARIKKTGQKREFYNRFWKADGFRLLLQEISETENMFLGTECFFMRKGQMLRPIEQERQLQYGDTVFLLITKNFREDPAKKEHLTLIQSVLDLKTIASPAYLAARIAELLDEDTSHLSYPLQSDDVVFVFGVRPRRSVVLLIGPPKNPKEDSEIIHQFLTLKGGHIVCGGTTATITSRYLNQPLEPLMETGTDEIPAMGRLKGIDLVTEGVITLKKLVEFAESYYENNRLIDMLRGRNDAVAILAKQILQQANQITIFLGCAVNPAHEELKIDFSIKQEAVEHLVEQLNRMGKQVVLKKC